MQIILHIMSKPPFTPSELEVMTVLWEHGELKPADIQQHFPRPIKNPALRSILGILCEKGHATRRMEGKAYLYSARTKRQKALREKLRELIDSYCDGSVRALLVHLSETENLSKDDIAALQVVANNKRGKKANH